MLHAMGSSPVAVERREMRSRGVEAVLALVVALLHAACGARSDVPVGSGPAQPAGAGGGGAGGGGTGAGGAGGGAGCAGEGETCAAAACCSGACVGGTCGSPACVEGDPPVVLASDLDWPYGIAVDGTHVYFTLYNGTGALMKVSKAGGDAVVLEDGLDFPDEIVLDASSIYLTVNGGGQILRFPKAGGDVELLASGQFGPSGIAADDATVFWVNYFAGEVASVPKAGGEVTLLAPAEANAFRMAAGADRIYWSGLTSGLRTMPKTGGPVTTMAGGDPRTMATDRTHVYWTDTEGDSLQRAELDEGAAETVASFPGAFPDGVAVDEDFAYVALAEGSVMKVGKGGGEPVVIASDQSSPTIVAVDDACVYWTNSALGTGKLGSVMRAPK
jgi:hypothetical protein